MLLRNYLCAYFTSVCSCKQSGHKSLEKMLSIVDATSIMSCKSCISDKGGRCGMLEGTIVVDFINARFLRQNIQDDTCINLEKIQCIYTECYL